MTWSPLACGVITGKYENGIPESSRASMKVGAGPGSFERLLMAAASPGILTSCFRFS